VIDIHSRVNNIPLDEMDKTYIGGSVPIDSVAATPSIIEYIEVCKLLLHCEVVLSDYRSYLVDINFEAYFEE